LQLLNVCRQNGLLLLDQPWRCCLLRLLLTQGGQPLLILLDGIGELLGLVLLVSGAAARRLQGLLALVQLGFELLHGSLGGLPFTVGLGLL
jgi:hypothetical protein